MRELSALAKELIIKKGGKMEPEGKDELALVLMVWGRVITDLRTLIGLTPLGFLEVSS
jgi:hypothetical protein